MSEVAKRRSSQLWLWALLAVATGIATWFLWRGSSWAAMPLLYGAFAAYLIRSANSLPDPMASHFNFQLQADSWMRRRTYLVLMAALALGVPLFLMMTSLRLGAPGGQANAHIPRMLAGFSCAFLALMFALHALVVQANRKQPAKLSGMIWVLMAVFVMSLSLIAMY